ncbi:efflux RND transporter periplasmic adaptor subunit [Marinobacter sp. GN3S48]|uniref:efflux RND transporter periplasmic adaptor subunit n=1 Tax=Marinobacter sp. GN3S48 TaxID=3382302 RepID=UPI00387A87F6
MRQLRPGFSMSALVLILCLAGHAAAQDRPRVHLEAVEEADILQEISLNGTVNALRTSRLSTAVPGLVDSVNVETGSRVSRGDLLIELDDEQVDYELAAARAATDEGKARLAEARRLLQEARSVGAGRNIAATEVSARESEVTSARAALARLDAEQQRVAADLRRHRIVAPFDGVVSQRFSDLGEWVTPGDELLQLVDTNNLRLDFQVPQDYFSRITDSAELRVHADGRSLIAHIEALVPVNDPQARTFILRATAPDGLTLLPGMAVTATLRVASGERGLTVARDAINRYPEGRVTVWIAEASGDGGYIVTEKRVETGSGFGDRVEITGGLAGGERVVVRGNESLSDGMEVQLAERGAN